MWIYLLLILAVLIVILLILPIHLNINSDEEELIRGRFGFLRIGIAMDGENVVAVNIYALFARFTLYPLKNKERKEDPVKKTKKRKKTSIISKWSKTKSLITIIWQYIKKSNVKKLYLNIDTSNMAVNSWLFPVLALISDKPRVDLNINYTGNFNVVLDVHNNLLNIILVIIRNLFKQ